MRATVVLILATGLAAASWQPIGPAGGYVTALACDPSAPGNLHCLVYTGRSSQPVFRTTDAGVNWTLVGEAPADWCQSLCIDPTAPGTLLALNDNDVVLRSTDHGATWTTIRLPAYATAICADPFIPGRIYIGAYTYNGISRPVVCISTDHGATWSSVSPADSGIIYSLECSAADSGVLYIGGDYGRVLRSTDHGATWQPRSSGISADNYVFGIAASHGNPAIVCAGTMFGMYRTTDAGASWNRVGDLQYIMSVDFSPAEPAQAVASGYDTATALFYTTDHGASWQRMAGSPSAARGGGLFCDPAAANAAWCATPSGVMYTSNLGATWLPRNNGIHTATVSALIVPEWNRQRVYAALEDIGIFKSPDGGRNWEQTHDFLSCGNICAIGLAASAGPDVLYALEGSG